MAALFDAYARGRPERSTADLGQRWELEHLPCRLWPSASSIQGPEHGAIDLIEQPAIDPTRVTKIPRVLSPPVFDLHGQAGAYKAKFDALISGHYTAAVILHGVDADARSVRARPLRRSGSCGVPRRSRAGFVPPSTRADRCAGGRRGRPGRHDATARCDVRWRLAENPFARAQIESKFRTYAEGAEPTRRRGDGMEAIGDLENLGSSRSHGHAPAAPRRGQATLAAVGR